MLSIFIPGQKLSLVFAVGVGTGGIKCCTAVLRRISEVPLPYSTVWAFILAIAMGKGSGCRTGNLQHAFSLVVLLPNGQVVTRRQAQMLSWALQGSQAVFFIALGPRGGLGIRAVVPDALLLLCFLAEFAVFDSMPLKLSFLCRHLILCILKQENQIPFFLM